MDGQTFEKMNTNESQLTMANLTIFENFVINFFTFNTFFISEKWDVFKSNGKKWRLSFKIKQTISFTKIFKR